MKEFEKCIKELGYNRRPSAYWRAACKHWLKVAQEHDQEIQFMIEDELDE